MRPPAIQAAKNRELLPAAPATMAGVRNMPIPTTRLNTTIAVSKVESRGRMDPRFGSSATKRRLQKLREPFKLVQIIVELRRDTQQRHRIRVEPCLDSLFPEPIVQALGVQSGGERAGLGRRQWYRRHRAEHRLRT